MGDGAPEPVAAEDSLDGVLGFEVLELAAGRATARVRIEDRLRQPLGLVHGGAYAALAESLASQATISGLGEGKIAVGLSNHTSFLRPVASGSIHAEALCRHRGRATWVWEVEMADDSGRSCALCRVTLAVRALEGRMPAALAGEDGAA